MTRGNINFIKNITTLTLGELLTHNDETIYRNSMSILKRLQKLNPQDDIEKYCADCGTEETPDVAGNCPICGTYLLGNN